jgi:signal transduction histidine kinase
LIWALNQENLLIIKNSIKNLINEELKLLEIQASQKNKIHNRIDANLDVVTDKKNKVRNLISNAIKYSYTKGAITISATVIDQFIKITVQDGIGMSTDA